jgi:hypothetical protein
MDIQMKLGQGPLGHDTIFAITSQGVIGYLQLADQRPGLDGRLIGHIEVSEQHRRKGVATKLWAYAKETGLNPIHAIDKTPEGDAWSRAVGD